MVVFGFELVEHVFDNTFLIDQEADAVKTIVDFTHIIVPLEKSYDRNLDKYKKVFLKQRIRLVVFLVEL